MKRFYFILIVILFAASTPGAAQKRLQFRPDGTFRILQLTDLHIDVPEGKSEMVFDLIDEMAAAEEPDLIVITGDIVTQWESVPVWERLIAQMTATGVPWTIVFGNHDDEKGITRREILDLVSKSPTCVIARGPANVAGVGNFVLELTAQGSSRPANVIYFFDSHAYSPEGVGKYGWIDRTQVDWYRTRSRRYGSTPAIAMFHIPTPEFATVAASGKFKGVQKEAVCCPVLNSGLFTAMWEQGDVAGIFVGHDHDNDFIGDHYGIALAYGRMSGSFSIYGALERGARVIVLTEGEKRFETYNRLTGGRIVDRCFHPDDFGVSAAPKPSTPPGATLEQLLRKRNPAMFE